MSLPVVDGLVVVAETSPPRESCTRHVLRVETCKLTQFPCLLLSDSYSAFATAVGTAEIDELASPPPAAPSNLAAATAAFAHPTRPSLVDAPLHATPSSSNSTIVVPKLEPNLNPPVLPPLPPLAAASVAPPLGQAAPPANSTGQEGAALPGQVPGAEEGSRVIEDAPVDEQKMQADAQTAGPATGASDATPSGESTETGGAAAV